MKKFIRFTLSILAIALPVTAFTAESYIRCQPLTKGSAITISLNAKKKFGKLLNCIDGEFIYDMEPCAPENGFGLSYPTGAAQLRTITFRWQDLMDHSGAVTSNTISETKIYFGGEFRSGADYVSELWVFEIDRLTGSGLLKVTEDNKTTNTKYTCNKANKKF
jgi:hypothetical protein